MNDKPHILICDDNIAVHESLTAYLKAEQIECASVFDGESALQQLSENHYDLLILDVMLPGTFGTEICRKIRRSNDIPIIMLSARSEEFDRVLGLELGADDYIVKPFSPREVVARIRAILKRAGSRVALKKLGAGRLTIDEDAYLVTLENKKVDLTPKEVELLIFLVKNAGKVLSREQILDRVWGFDYTGDTRAVDTQVKRLRQKLPEEDTGLAIQTLYGVGYRLEVPE